MDNLIFDITIAPLTNREYRFDMGTEQPKKLLTPSEVLESNVHDAAKYINRYGFHILIDEPNWMSEFVNEVVNNPNGNDVDNNILLDSVNSIHDDFDGWISTHSFTPELSMVTGIAVSKDGSKPSGAVVNDRPEEEILQRFWDLYSQSRRIVSWNTGGKLAFIISASIRNGVKPIMGSAPAVLGQPWKAMDHGAIIDILKFRYYLYPQWKGAMPSGYNQSPLSLSNIMQGKAISNEYESPSDASLYMQGKHDKLLSKLTDSLSAIVYLARSWQGNYLPLLGIKGELL